MNTTEWLPVINRAACTGCNACIEVCPTHALGKVDSKAALVDPDACTYCTLCELICPVEAIELPYLVVKLDSGAGEA